MEKDSLIIIDGNSLANRAFYAMTGMSTARGEPVGAVYGFTTMLLKLIEDYRPKYIAATFDVHAPTFRHELSSLYKATRKGMPPDLAVQMDSIKSLLAAMGIKIYELAGYEADDIMGTIARTDVFTYIVTGDRDTVQLVDGSTHILLTKRGITDIIEVTPDNAHEIFGVPTERVVDFKALAGDKSDNIPGVAGIGEKSAQELISAYGSLDGVYENIDKITGSKHDKLLADKDNAYLSYKLAVIDRNVPIDFSVDDCKFAFPFSAAVRDEFSTLEFKSLLKRDELFDSTRDKTPDFTSEVKQIPLTPETLTELVNDCTADKVAVIFLPDGMHLAVDRTTDYYAPITNDLFGVFTENKCIEAIKPLFSRHIVTFDLKALLHKAAPSPIPDADDVSVMGYLLEYRLSPKTASELLSCYSDCKAELAARGMTDLYENIEKPLLCVLFDMEREGFCIDRDRLDEIDRHFSRLEQESAMRIRTIYGGDFNLNSPKQLAKVLFDDLKIPYPGKPPYSTKAEILQKLAGEYEIIDEILKYRFNSKLKSTFIDGLRKALRPDGTVHTSFNQTTTSTGRLSSTDPNLQNIPTRTEEGKLLRSLFIPRKGNVLVDADYSQIELKLLANFSADPKMCGAFVDGQDIHSSTASEVFGVAPEDVTPLMRREAKAVNFGIVYGISNYGLSQNINIPPKKADEYIKRYFERFPAVKAYLDGLIESAKKCGYAVTKFGRRRSIPELNSAKYIERKFGERVAMNMPLQGSAADIIKIAMINVHKALDGMKSRLILQVHDELIVDTHPDELDEVLSIVKTEMENAVSLSVPLNVDASVGKNWMECK